MAAISRLDRHVGIALDLDDTLIGHEKSLLLQQYVAAHHKSKRFWIVTFRGDQWLDQAWEDLDRYGGAARPHMFRGLRACPPDVLESLFQWYASGRESEESEVFEWKGSVARELACTVLVDDRPEWVLPGCRRNRIEFIATGEL